MENTRCFGCEDFFIYSGSECCKYGSRDGILMPDKCPRGRGLTPKERKITSEQVLTLFNLMGNGNTKLARNYLKNWFPEAFKPVQEFCCTAFKRAVVAGDIWKDEERWKFCFFKTGWESFMLSCPNCGQKPKPPIKEKL